MPVRQSAIGSKLTASEVAVTVREVLAYAAGIGDTSPSVFDDLRDDLCASPPYCVRLEWPVVSHPDARAHLGAALDELRRGVHAVQDSHFHRPVRPGSVLRTEGQIVDVRPTRAGALTTMRVTTTNESGEVLVTSWTSSIYRGVGVEEVRDIRSKIGQLDTPPGIPERSGTLTVERSKFFVPVEMAHVYTECARIWNPIHTERRVAVAAGLPDIILHGTATWALAGREIARAFARGDSTRLKRLHGRFSGMVRLGSEIEFVMAANEVGEVWFEVLDDSGEPVLSHGFAGLTID